MRASRKQKKPPTYARPWHGGKTKGAAGFLLLNRDLGTSGLVLTAQLLQGFAQLTVCRSVVGVDSDGLFKALDGLREAAAFLALDGLREAAAFLRARF